MILRTSAVIVLAVAPAFAFSKTIYSGEFDYREFRSPEQYFSGKTPTEITRMCNTGEHTSNDDLAQCSHLKFNRASRDLNRKLILMRKAIAADDVHLKDQGEPLAMPFFNQTQESWTKYRDSECYTETYMMGEAAERYIFFWECMATITQTRVKEITDLLKN
jgi:uncharacterized protein YecT (DUF1311 family)